jgi:hypothetical protein
MFRARVSTGTSSPKYSPVDSDSPAKTRFNSPVQGESVSVKKSTSLSTPGSKKQIVEGQIRSSESNHVKIRFDDQIQQVTTVEDDDMWFAEQFSQISLTVEEPTVAKQEGRNIIAKFTDGLTSLVYGREEPDGDESTAAFHRAGICMLARTVRSTPAKLARLVESLPDEHRDPFVKLLQEMEKDEAMAVATAVLEEASKPTKPLAIQDSAGSQLVVRKAKKGGK